MAGRPSKYSTSFNKQAFKLCLLGATDKELADFFEVCEDTIYEWKEKHKQFSESIKKGKTQADAEVVNKLYNRALGFKYNEITFEKIDSKQNIEMTEDDDIIASDTYKKKIVTKEALPDTTAQIYWLKNRQKEKWRDKQEVGITDNEGNDVTPTIVLNQFLGDAVEIRENEV